MTKKVTSNRPSRQTAANTQKISDEDVPDYTRETSVAVLPRGMKEKTPAAIQVFLSFVIQKIVCGKIFFTVVLALTILDLALLERKYDVFKGGFLQADRIATFNDRLLFVTTALSLEVALAACFWYFFLLIGSFRNMPVQLSRYWFVLFYGGISILATIAKYKIFAYFGDFLSIAVLRNLGGGSLQGALIYALEEGLIIGGVFAFATAISWYFYYQLKIRVLAKYNAISVIKPLYFVGGILMSISLLLMVSIAARSNASMHKHLSKTTPYAIADHVISLWIMPEPSILMEMKAKVTNPSVESHHQVTFPTNKDNLILIVSESTRADVLDTVINGNPITPNWRAMATEGGVAKKYYSHAGFTSSSLKAMFRGSLGTRLPLGGTLFEILKDRGYQVVVLSGQDESFGNIETDTGAKRSADIFFDARSAKDDRVFNSTAPSGLKLSNERIVQEFEKISAKIDWHRPIFFYINLQAAHFPYYHPRMPLVITQDPLERSEISEESLEDLKLTYFNSVAYSDWATGKIISRLKHLGVYQRSLIAVAGDHGESLFDDRILGHGIKINDSQLHSLLVTNRHLAAMDGLLGQIDLAKVLLSGIGAQLEPTGLSPRSSLIQIVGDLKAPSQLGYIYANGERLTLDNAKSELHASWLPKPIKFSALRPESREYEELHRLTGEWVGTINGTERSKQ